MIFLTIHFDLTAILFFVSHSEKQTIYYVIHWGRQSNVNSHIKREDGHHGREDGHFKREDNHVRRDDNHVKREDVHIKREDDYKPKPDYGNSYVPGAGPEHYAPNSLDHFKRGYEERAAHRDKEFYSLNHGPTGRAGGGGGDRRRPIGWSSSGDNGGNGGGPSAHGMSGDRRNGYGGGGGQPRNSRQDDSAPWNKNARDHQRPTILQGLDIQALVDRLSTKLSVPDELFADLDETRSENRNVFDSGKAMTALISVAARRRNIGLGHALWDWMDRARIAKNTFHYNSMISVTEKARDYQKALHLLKEMKDRNIPKNEVT
jgi:pentatricopeptide repeat protein